MTHTRACPTCGKIVPWIKRAKGMKRRKVFGKTIISYEMMLFCPEHGEFRNPAEERVLRKMRIKR